MFAKQAQGNTDALKKNYKDLTANPLRKAAESSTKQLKKNYKDLSGNPLEKAARQSTKELKQNYETVKNMMQNAPAPSSQRALTPQQKAAEQEFSRQQLNINRQLLNNTRYQQGKKNAAGYYETKPGQYATAIASGSIPSSEAMRAQYQAAFRYAAAR